MIKYIMQKNVPYQSLSRSEPLPPLKRKLQSDLLNGQCGMGGGGFGVFFLSFFF